MWLFICGNGIALPFRLPIRSFAMFRVPHSLFHFHSAVYFFIIVSMTGQQSLFVCLFNGIIKIFPILFNVSLSFKIYLRFSVWFAAIFLYLVYPYCFGNRCIIVNIYFRIWNTTSIIALSDGAKIISFVKNGWPNFPTSAPTDFILAPEMVNR